MKSNERILLEWCLFLFSSFMCGFAQGTISFTAAPVLIPLLLNFLNFELTTCFFISVMIDLSSSLLLVVIYRYHKKLIVFSGVCFGFLQLPATIILPILLRQFLLEHVELLKGNIPFLPILMSFMFIFRGFTNLIHSKLFKKKKNKSTEESVELEQTDEPKEIKDQSFLKKNINVVKSFIHEELKEHSYPKEELASNSTFYENLKFKLKGNPGEDILFHPNVSFKSLRILLFGFLVFVNSLTDGMLYKGGGFGINLFIHFIFKQKHSVSTATACFMSVFSYLGLSISFIGQTSILTMEVLYHLIGGIFFSSLGAFFGSIWVIYFSDVWVFFVVGFNLLIVGIISILQTFI
jgi:uncharacterized membrane protein YfcA